MMYVVEKRRIDGPVCKWFKIWESEDGADCAAYLQTVTVLEAGRSEVRMRFLCQNNAWKECA